MGLDCWYFHEKKIFGFGCVLLPTPSFHGFPWIQKHFAFSVHNLFSCLVSWASFPRTQTDCWSMLFIQNFIMLYGSVQVFFCCFVHTTNAFQMRCMCLHISLVWYNFKSNAVAIIRLAAVLRIILGPGRRSSKFQLDIGRLLLFCV